jgi:hypothetical protein
MLLAAAVEDRVVDSLGWLADIRMREVSAPLEVAVHRADPRRGGEWSTWWPTVLVCLPAPRSRTGIRAG